MPRSRSSAPRGNNPEGRGAATWLTRLRSPLSPIAAIVATKNVVSSAGLAETLVPKDCRRGNRGTHMRPWKGRAPGTAPIRFWSHPLRCSAYVRKSSSQSRQNALEFHPLSQRIKTGSGAALVPGLRIPSSSRPNLRFRIQPKQSAGSTITGGLLMATAPTIEMHSKVAEFISKPRKMLINGKWVEAASGKTFPTYNPATGEVLLV